MALNLEPIKADATKRRATIASSSLGHMPEDPAGHAGALLDTQDELIAEVERLERLRDFDTGTTPLPKGLMLEHARLDGMWQQLVRERDAARAEVERLSAIQKSTARDLDTARATIATALSGVIEYEEHAGWWWNGAERAINALRAELDGDDL